MTTFAKLSRDFGSSFYGYDAIAEIPVDVLHSIVNSKQRIAADKTKHAAVRQLARSYLNAERPLIDEELERRGYYRDHCE